MSNKIFAANWKMYLNSNESREFMLKINANKDLFLEFDIIIFPSHVAISIVQDLAKEFDNIKIRMQDCDILTSGAVTGSNSITSHKVDSCIVGHSERRTIFNENDELIKKKLNNCLDQIGSAILCIGETLNEKEQNKTFEVIKKQLSILPNQIQGKNLDIAYEPVWAIGTGKTASPEQAQAVHLFIRSLLGENNENIAQNTPILYGGSMNAGNANELIACADIDGGLIGGAALKAEDFLQICKAG